MEIREERALVEGVEEGGEDGKCIIIDTSQQYSGIWNVLIEIQWDTENYTSIIQFGTPPLKVTSDSKNKITLKITAGAKTATLWL